MRKRLLSGFLALCLLASVFPVNALAEKWNEQESAPDAVQTSAAEADWMLPVSNGAGLSLMLSVAPVIDTEVNTPAVGGGTVDGGDIGAEDSSSTDAALTFVPLNLQLQVIPADSLVMTKSYLTGFYSGVGSFDAYVYLEGFAEEDLNALQLQLLDENDQVVTQNTGTEKVMRISLVCTPGFPHHLLDTGPLKR